MTIPQVKATFSQNRNDMYWSIYDLDDKRITWSGYDDEYWWDKISKSEKWPVRVGVHSGRTYRLNVKTNMVDVTEP